MNASCQFAIYPLGVDRLGPPLDAALEAVRRKSLDPEVGPTSNLISRRLDQEMTALAEAFEAAAGASCVMVMTLSNACPVPDPAAD